MCVRLCLQRTLIPSFNFNCIPSLNKQEVSSLVSSKRQTFFKIILHRFLYSPFIINEVSQYLINSSSCFIFLVSCSVSRTRTTQMPTTLDKSVPFKIPSNTKPHSWSKFIKQAGRKEGRYYYYYYHHHHHHHHHN